MKRFLFAGLVLALPAVSAGAQNTTPGTVTQPSSPAPANATTPPSTTRLSTVQPTPAQTTRATTAPANQAAAPVGVVPGANSFTESQAKSRLEKNGYSQVANLIKGNDGIWRGQAMKDGASVRVSLDYKGDISVN